MNICQLTSNYVSLNINICQFISMGPVLRKTRRCLANNERLFANCINSITSVASVATVLPSNQIPSVPSEHHYLPEHNSSPSGQAWSYACSNMHWRPYHKSWYHHNAIHHSKPAIVSSKYQTCIQRPFVHSPNLSRSILQEMNSQHRHRDKLTWASEGSRCHILNTHLNPAPLCHLQCNTSTGHP